MRLDKFAAYAAESRKEIKKFISKGRVTVNGEIIRDSGFSVSDEDDVRLDGRQIFYRAFIYLMMHKPAGVISATYDPQHKTVTDLLPEKYKRFKPFPVGRLDIDTEGLLLMTNDGRMAHALLSPSRKIPKTYEATVDGEITSEHIEKFRNGIILDDGYKTKPASLCVLREGSETVAEVIITEGKTHQVKRMFADIGRRVLYLKRTAFAALTLDEGLGVGEFRELSEKEVHFLSKLMQ